VQLVYDQLRLAMLLRNEAVIIQEVNTRVWKEMGKLQISWTFHLFLYKNKILGLNSYGFIKASVYFRCCY